MGRFVAAKTWRGGAALHVDTGFNRLGITPDEAVAIAWRIQSEHHGFTLLMSQLACGDTPDHAMNDRQIRMFREIRIMYRGMPSSLAHSSGIFLGGTVYCDLVRPGAALFGVNPTPGRPNPMRPVVELKARIIQVRTIKRGESVGYGASLDGHPAEPARDHRRRLCRRFPALGRRRQAQGAAEVIMAGKRCPLAGRVSMDLLAVDVTDLAEGTVRRGDLATLIGDGIGVDDSACRHGNHRLRGAREPRTALSPGLQERVDRIKAFTPVFAGYGA